jgi:hypothetical protein
MIRNRGGGYMSAALSTRNRNWGGLVKRYFKFESGIANTRIAEHKGVT